MRNILANALIALVSILAFGAFALLLLGAVL